jgi:hypothetical protein
MAAIPALPLPHSKEGEAHVRCLCVCMCSASLCVTMTGAFRANGRTLLPDVHAQPGRAQGFKGLGQVRDRGSELLPHSGSRAGPRHKAPQVLPWQGQG